MKVATLRRVFRYAPLIFAAGFLTPLLSQTIQALNIPLPAGVSALAAGFGLAMTFGLVAQIRGRWV